MGVRVVRGRWVGGLLGAAGVLALAPSVFWPTRSFTYPAYSGPDATADGHVVNLSWSWGKFGVQNPPEGMEVPDTGNTLGLLFLVVVLLVGAAGTAAWLLVRGAQGQLLGVAGTAVVGTYAAHTVTTRVGQNLAFDGSDPSVRLGTPPAGVLEVAAVGILVAALLVMLWRPLLDAGRTAWRLAAARAVAARAVDEAGGPSVGDETRGSIIVRGERTGDGTLPRRPPGPGPAAPVGFTDPPAGDDRFQVPG